MKITRSHLKQIIMEELERLIEGPTEDPAVNELIGALEFIIEDVVRVLKEGGRTLGDALRLGLKEIWYTGAKEDYEVEAREEQLDDFLVDYPEEKIMVAIHWLMKEFWEQEMVDSYGGDSLAMQAALQEDEEGAEAEEHLRARYAELSAKAAELGPLSAEENQEFWTIVRALDPYKGAGE
jgi:hypothetical protein